MSKWKSGLVKIEQIVHAGSYDDIYGIGDDQMMYRWDRMNGAWEKFYEEEDRP